MTNEFTARIEQLEARIAYGERTVDELNAVITEQWREINKMRREFARMTDRLIQLEAAGPEEDQLPPPHY